MLVICVGFFFFFQAEDGIRDLTVTGVQTCALPISITWRGVAIGAIFLRTFRDGPTFSDEDVRIVQVVAALTAQALRNAHRYERLEQRQQETGETLRRMELERVALLAFLRRLLGAFGEREGAWAEGLLPRASSDELERLVGVAMAVIQEEAKGQ